MYLLRKKKNDLLFLDTAYEMQIWSNQLKNKKLVLLLGFLTINACSLFTCMQVHMHYQNTKLDKKTCIFITFLKDLKVDC